MRTMRDLEWNRRPPVGGGAVRAPSKLKQTSVIVAVDSVSVFGCIARHIVRRVSRCILDSGLVERNHIALLGRVVLEHVPGQGVAIGPDAQEAAKLQNRITYLT